MGDKGGVLVQFRFRFDVLSYLVNAEGLVFGSESVLAHVLPPTCQQGSERSKASSYSQKQSLYIVAEDDPLKP